MTSFFKSPVWILFLVCVILEAVGLVLMVLEKSSICIIAYEVSKGAMVFQLFIFTAVVPDLIFVISIIFMKNVGKDPLGIMYNLVIGIGCLVGSIVLILMLTYCGNSDQIMILIAGVLGILAGLIHLVNFGFSHWNLAPEESYAFRRAKEKD